MVPGCHDSIGGEHLSGIPETCGQAQVITGFFSPLKLIISSFPEHLLFFRHTAKHFFPDIICSVYKHVPDVGHTAENKTDKAFTAQPSSEVGWFSPFHRWGNWGPEGLRNPPASWSYWGVELRVESKPVFTPSALGLYLQPPEVWLFIPKARPPPCLPSSHYQLNVIPLPPQQPKGQLSRFSSPSKTALHLIQVAVKNHTFPPFPLAPVCPFKVPFPSLFSTSECPVVLQHPSQLSPPLRGLPGFCATETVLRLPNTHLLLSSCRGCLGVFTYLSVSPTCLRILGGFYSCRAHSCWNTRSAQ